MQGLRREGVKRAVVRFGAFETEAEGDPTGADLKLERVLISGNTLSSRSILLLPVLVAHILCSTSPLNAKDDHGNIVSHEGYYE